MTDIHKLKASKQFNVPYNEVTPEQRRIAKALNFGEAYGSLKEAREHGAISSVIERRTTKRRG